MKAGRPPKYNNAADLQKKIDEYFEGEPKKPTISGLVLHCGFCDRSSFYEYEEKKEFTYTIKRARLMIAESYEKDLRGNNVTGSIFALKNLGWMDEKTYQHNFPGINPIEWAK